jgi:hypothetical protein
VKAAVPAHLWKTVERVCSVLPTGGALGVSFPYEERDPVGARGWWCSTMMIVVVVLVEGRLGFIVQFRQS